MKGDYKMEELWNKPYFDRRTWLLDHLESLHIDAKEAIVLMLIDYCKDIKVMITHEIIAQKCKMEVDEVEEIFLSLSDKGYLNIKMNKGNIDFDIQGVYEQKNFGSDSIQRSLIDTFEYEFKRTLSSYEMQRIIEMASVYDERRVICALNEAVVYEKTDLNYIEKILISWKQKGYSIEDVENGLR